MLVSEMFQEIRDHGFDDLTDTRLLGFVNDTYFDINSREAWPYLEAMTTPTVDTVTGAITAPTDISKVLKLVDTSSGLRLEPRRADEFLQRFANKLTVVGAPYLYYNVGDTWSVYPIPAAATLKLQYIKAAAALTSSPDSSPILPTRHHRLIVLGSLVKCYMLEDDAENAAVFTNTFEQRITQMRNDLWFHQFDRPDTILSVDDYDWVDYLQDANADWS